MALGLRVSEFKIFKGPGFADEVSLVPSAS